MIYNAFLSCRGNGVINDAGGFHLLTFHLPGNVKVPGCGLGATAALGFKLVTGGVTDIEDVDDTLAECKDDSMLVPLLPTIEQFADFFGETVALGGDRASQGSGLQGVDGFVEPGQPFIGGGGRYLLA